MSELDGVFEEIGFSNCLRKNFVGGFTNASSLLRKGSKKAVLRVYKKSRGRSNIKFELNFISALKKENLPVPSSISSTFKDGENYCVVFEYLPGRKISYAGLNKTRVNSLMDAVSKIHLIGSKISIGGSKDERNLFTFRFDDFIKKTVYPKISLKMEVLLTEELEFLRSKLSPKHKKFKRIIIHNDLGLINVKFLGNYLSAILDFDDCCYGPRVSDLATLLAETIVTRRGVDVGKLRQMLKRYDLNSKLSSEEVRVLGFLIRHRLLVATNFYLWKYMGSKKPCLMKKALLSFRKLVSVKNQRLSYKGILLER